MVIVQVVVFWSDPERLDDANVGIVALASHAKRSHATMSRRYMQHDRRLPTTSRAHNHIILQRRNTNQRSDSTLLVWSWHIHLRLELAHLVEQNAADRHELEALPKVDLLT